MTERVMDDACVVSVARFVVWADVDQGDEGGAVSQVSFSARLDAVLDDGRRIVLLNNRGWSQTRFGADGSGTSWQGYPPDWSVTREEIEESAWDVVGPEYNSQEYPDAAAVEVHWSSIAKDLEREGVKVDPTDLATTPGEIEFGPRVRARLRD